MRPDSPSHLSSIQGLRGFAAMLVLFLHVSGTIKVIGGYPKDALSGFWDNGYAGVDLFFVISGFIMVYVTQTYDRGLGSSIRFLKARIIRIYPLWWVYASIMGLILFLLFGQPARPEVAASAGGAWRHFLQSLALWPQTSHPTLVVGWTLIFEMYYYLIFAVLLLLPRRYLSMALVIWGAQILLSQSLPDAKGWIELVRSPLSLEFIAGAFAGLLVVKKKIISPLVVLGVGMVLFCGALVFLADGGPWHRDWSRVIFFGLPGALIAHGLVNLEMAKQIKTPRWARALGDWSYSLYLCHVIVILVVKNIWEFLEPFGLPEIMHLKSQGYWGELSFALVAICASLFTAMLSYHFIERPATAKLRQKWLRPRG